MRFDIVTIFPKIFDSWAAESIVKRAGQAGLIKIESHDIRKFTTDVHKSVDDTPYGGGAGMVMRPEPLVACVEAVPKEGRYLRILLSPQGEPLNQALVKELSSYDQLILICGRYEGIDERARNLISDREISAGDYITAGGEAPAMVLMEAVIRLIPGVLGNESSIVYESFENGLLEYPQYTRPEVFRGERVPDVLLSGHHAKIEEWRRLEALKRTKNRRADLLKGTDITTIDKKTKRR